MKRKWITAGFYICLFAMYLIPWITVGEESYSVLRFISHPIKEQLENWANMGILSADAQTLTVGIGIEIALMGLLLVLSIIYVLEIFCGKQWPINILTLFAGVLVSYYHHQFPGTLNDICGGSPRSVVCSMMFLLLPSIEFFTVMIVERWQETVKEVKEYQQAEADRKKERKERLAFAGRYNVPFYRVVWKNFKSNWKDYILLLFCSSLIFSFVVTGFGIQRLLSQEYHMENIQALSELNAILLNAILPLAVISVFIIILLLFYYLKCRAKNYGVFLTLGMRRKALYYFAGLEFLSVFVISALIGGCVGSFVLFLFTKNSVWILGTAIPFSAVGIRIYFSSLATVLIVYGISAMAARDIFVDFNVGKSTDLRAIGEKIILKHRKPVLLAGLLICGSCIWSYGQIRNYEKVSLLLVFFAGLFLVIRYGLAEYLLAARKKKGYLKKVVTRSQLFHQSKTSAGYMFAVAVIQFCVLFYFSFQVISCAIAEADDVLYPYDVMCLADTEDLDVIENIQQECKAEITQYPMVRVSNYDPSERRDVGGDAGSVQGQQIGISESSYHALKKAVDPDYQAKDLGLDAEGKKVYLVHQQDKSTKAQPVDFYGSARRPILSVSLPVDYVDMTYVSHDWDDISYHYREIAGEEIGSLTGTFRQGLRENLVVFSDAYFEEAKELWKTTDLADGLYTTQGLFHRIGKRVEDARIKQGPSHLILIRADEKELDTILTKLQELEERHTEEKSYDASVLRCYTKKDALQNQQTERSMKMVMNLLIIIIFFIMNLILLSIKMLSELDLNRKRAEFLDCMGMYRKDRIRLLKKEVLVHFYVIPVMLAVLVALLFTIATFHGRMYGAAEQQLYLKYMIPLWGVYLVGMFICLWILTVIYVNAVEKHKKR